MVEFGNPFAGNDDVAPVMDTEIDRSELIEKTRWSSEFSYRQVTAFAKYMRTFEAAKAAIVFREGDHSNFMCLVAKGRVGIVKKSSGQAIKHLATVGAGSTFGEMALIDASPRSATVVADEATTLLVLTQHAFDTISLEAPQLALALVRCIARQMSQRLRRTSGVLSDHLDPIKAKEKA